MIVNNEAHCIERCLDSVKPIIDCVIINDNGSTDGTQDKIHAWGQKNDIDTITLNDPWVSFDVNRSLVLKSIYALQDIDYVLMIDADEVLVFEAGYNPEKIKESLVCDLYDIESRLGGTSYLRPQLSSNKRKFKYSGVVHEFIVAEEEVRSRGTVKGLFNMPIQDSARNKDPDKFLKDAQALEKAFNETTDPFLKSRYCFYTGQCYKDAGRNALAIAWYLRRVDLGWWDEEKYMALLNAGRLQKGFPDVYSKDACIVTFCKAIEYSKNRAEALCEIMILLREMGCWSSAYYFGVQALQKTKIDSALFLEHWIYDYVVPFEMSIICWYAGDKTLGYTLTKSLIENTKIPQNIRDQSKENLKHYEPSTTPTAMSGGS